MTFEAVKYGIIMIHCLVRVTVLQITLLVFIYFENSVINFKKCRHKHLNLFLCMYAPALICQIWEVGKKKKEKVAL